MRFKARGVLLALVAVLVMSAVASTSASAETCHKTVGSKKFALCIAGIEQGFPTETPAVAVSIALKSGTSARVGGSFLGGSYVVCKKAEGSVALKSDESNLGGIKAGTLGVAMKKMEFTQCTFEGAPKCKITRFFFERLYGKFGPGVEPVTFFTPPRENHPGSLIIPAEAGCSAYGEYLFKAKAIEHEEYEGPRCTVTEPEVEKSEHLLKCEKQNSNLTTGGKTVNFEVEESVVLSGTKNGQNFSIVEST